MRVVKSNALRGALALAAASATFAIAAPAWGADPVRSFDGSDDQVQVRATSGVNVTGAVTMVALIRPDTLANDFDIAALHTSGGSGSGYDFFFDSNGQFGFWTGSSVAYGPPNPIVADEWQLVAVTKASGTATPRFHVYRYSNSSWSHANATSTVGNGGSVSGGTLRLGSFEDGDLFDGEYAAAAIYPSALSDMAIEGIETSYDDWLSASPGGMWILNQVSNSHPILDETGNGADEVDDTVDPSVLTNLSPISGDPDTTLFRGDFSTGDTSQWWDVQEVGANASVTVANSSPAPPAGETYYGRYELQGGDERAEVYHGMELAEGEDVYVRFLVRLEEDFPAELGVWGQLIWQLHQEGGGSPPIALYIDGTNPGSFALQDENNGYWWQGPNIDEEQWHEFVIRVHHSEDDEEGFVELWLDDVKQTLANSADRMYGATLLDAYNYPKSGYYRDDAMLGTGIVQIAGYRIARDKNDLP